MAYGWVGSLDLYGEPPLFQICVVGLEMWLSQVGLLIQQYLYCKSQVLKCQALIGSSWW